MEDIKQKIIDFYKNYDINISIEKIVEAYQVDRYFLRLDRSNKTRIMNIEKLVDDLSAELGIKNIKFTTDFETGGIVFEIPKKDRKTLYIKDLAGACELASKGLQVCFGKDLNNNNYIVDLCNTPHLLIAGTTGSGKSMFINSILINLLNNYKKDYLELSLIDPKKVELSIYKNVKQVKEIANTLSESRKVLENILLEIDTRYKQLELINCRNIESYNQKAFNKMPYKVIIIDELADILLQDKKECQNAIKRGLNVNSLENIICRIAQIGRACGVHLIVATQRPSSDIITGLIKANIPSRVAFSVSSRIDSRVILDEKGAEKLTGKGDMLFKMVGDEEIHRIQGAFVSDEEIEKAVNENIDQEEIQKQKEMKQLKQQLEEKQKIEYEKEQEQKRKEKEKQRKHNKELITDEKIKIVCNVFGEWFLMVLGAILSSILPFILVFFLSPPVAIILLILAIGSVIYGLIWKIRKELKDFKNSYYYKSLIE